MVRDVRRRERLKRALQCGIALGDGGYLLELERHGYVDSGSGREKVARVVSSRQRWASNALKRCGNCIENSCVSRTQLFDR